MNPSSSTTTMNALLGPATPTPGVAAMNDPSHCHRLVDDTSPAKTSNNEVSQLNNTGASLLQNHRTAEAANLFLRALWQVEGGKTATTAGLSFSHFHHPSSMNAVPSWNGPGSNTFQSGNHNYGERAKPSSYIFQREGYDEGLHVYQEGLVMPFAATPEEQLIILRCNMGQVYLRYKQYNQARRWFQAAWILHQQQQHQKPGDRAQRILYLLHNLAFSYYCLGENSEALQCYQDALHWTGTTEHDRATTYNCIAVLLFHKSTAKANDTDRALSLLQESLPIFQKFYGETSPQVATCLGNMGRIHFLTSAHELALKAFHKAYHIRQQVLGKDSLDTAAMLFNLGQSLHYRGALDEALEAYQEFFRVAQLHYNPTGAHRDICAVQRAMAQVQRQKSNLSEACTLLQNAYKVGCDALGANEPEVSCILSELGSLHAEQKDYPKAIDCFLRFLQSQEEEDDEDDDEDQHTTTDTTAKNTKNNILITKINLARVYKHSSDYWNAFCSYKEVHSLQVEAKASGLEIASTLSSMGLMLYLLQAYKPALDCYQEALRVRLDKLGTSQHTEVAETINSIGLVLFKLGMMDMAKEAFRECIQLRSKLSQDSVSKEIAVLLFNMATACLQNGEDEMGMEYYNESLRVERQVLGEHHSDVGMTLQHIARVHEERGDFATSILFYRQALDIAQRQPHNADDKNNKRSEAMAKLLRTIGNLHFMQAQVADAMACFAEASRLLPAAAAGNDRFEGVTVVGANFYGMSRLHPPAASTA